MAACWRCGSETPTGAKFCPECGAELRAVADLDVFGEPQPAGGHIEPTDTNAPRWLLVGALALIGGLVAFFALVGDDDWPSADPFEDRADFEAIDDPIGDVDSEDRETEEPELETTDEEPPPAEIAGPLDWDVALTGGVGFPALTIDIGESTFVYSIDGNTAWTTGGELHTYRRAPGGEWTDVGTMLDAGARVTAVWPTPAGAVAVGSDADARPTLWRTTDGTTWNADVLPPVGDLGFDGAIPRIAATNDDITVVVGSPPDPWALLHDEVRKRFDDVNVGLEISGGPDMPTTVTVRGPFGIVVDELELTELGIDPELFDDSNNANLVDVPTWENTGDGWGTSSSDGRLHDVMMASDRVLGVWANELGPEVRPLAEDGWGEPIRFANVWQINPWGDRFVGANRMSGVAVFDGDGELIERYDVPGAAAMGNIVSVTADDTGMVVLESIWEPTEEPESRIRTVVLRDGYTLEAADGELELRTGDEIILRSSLFWMGGNDRHTVDLAAPEPQITFLSEDGEPLVAFTIAELADLERQTHSVFDSRERLRVLFSDDGSTWYGGEVGTEDSFGWMETHLTGSRIIATQLQGDAWNPGQNRFEFTILEAPLPD